MPNDLCADRRVVFVQQSSPTIVPQPLCVLGGADHVGKKQSCQNSLCFRSRAPLAQRVVDNSSNAVSRRDKLPVRIVNRNFDGYVPSFAQFGTRFSPQRSSAARTERANRAGWYAGLTMPRRGQSFVGIDQTTRLYYSHHWQISGLLAL